jgi:hypothetical protein
MLGATVEGADLRNKVAVLFQVRHQPARIQHFQHERRNRFTGNRLFTGHIDKQYSMQADIYTQRVVFADNACIRSQGEQTVIHCITQIGARKTPGYHHTNTRCEHDRNCHLHCRPTTEVFSGHQNIPGTNGSGKTGSSILKEVLTQLPRVYRFFFATRRDNIIRVYVITQKACSAIQWKQAHFIIPAIADLMFGRFFRTKISCAGGRSTRTWRRKENRSTGITHAPLEIAVGRGKYIFAVVRHRAACSTT